MQIVTKSHANSIGHSCIELCRVADGGADVTLGPPTAMLVQGR